MYNPNMKLAQNFLKLFIAINLLSVGILSCAKEEISPATTPNSTPVTTNLSASYNSNGLIANRYSFALTPKEYPLYDPKNTGGLSGGVDQATNGTLLYSFQNVEHIIINPSKNGGTYTSPLHFVNSKSEWKLENGDYGKLMDMPRNSVQVSDGIFAWANASLENDITGNVYLSKTNASDGLTWSKISNNDGFYHYLTSGDIDNDGVNEVLTYRGAELQQTDKFYIWKQDGTIIADVLPFVSEFEDAIGFVRRDRNPNQKLDSFSFGSVTVANLDLTSPEPELIITSTIALMNEYYSFILLNYDKSSKKFKISKVIKTNGALKDNKLAVGDVKTGYFNFDDKLDVVVSMGNGIDDKFGIQIWYGNGKGDLIPGKNSIFRSSDLNDFSNFEVGRFKNKKVDDIFLHYTARDINKVALLSNGLDLNRFFLINDGIENTPFTNPTNLYLPYSVITYDKNTARYMIPPFIKGYFINNKLRMIGFKGRLDMYGNNNTSFTGYNEFDLYDLTY